MKSSYDHFFKKVKEDTKKKSFINKKNLSGSSNSSSNNSNSNSNSNNNDYKYNYKDIHGNAANHINNTNKMSQKRILKNENQDKKKIEEIFRKNHAKRRNKLKKKSAFPYLSLIFISFAFCITIAGLYLDDLWGERFYRISVNFLKAVNAEEILNRKNMPINKKDEEKNSGSKEVSGKNDLNKKVEVDDNEFNYVNKLKARKNELDKREEQIVKLEAELQQQKKDIETKILELSKLQNNIAEILQERVQMDARKIEKLAQFYSNMKPVNAAQVINSINEDLAIEILEKMKKKSVADIFNVLDAKKAQNLSEKLAGYKN